MEQVISGVLGGVTGLVLGTAIIIYLWSIEDNISFIDEIKSLFGKPGNE